MIKPKRLYPRSTIGVISPSYWIDKHILEQASKIFTDRNYKLVFGKSIHSKNGPFAGNAKIRAEDIHTMFLDSRIDAIVCARGGYGANKVIPLLDYELIKNNPNLMNQISELRKLMFYELNIRAGYKEEESEEMAKEAFDIYFKGRNTVTFYEGVIDTLKLLKEKYSLGVVTNGNADLKIIGIDHLFDYCFFNDIKQYQ